ncbi:hypothetical protein P255_02807 [Acinetobacter brisouii CIP 110357]|uniref:Uncharacterized protein n=1 Tax=Acinetobacter brisouii CIP 110357 TaxID=1341683 RepID=V2U4M1_9GAMM|nr:hypothetical protein F954_00059 [Acinetobacter brisouii ANC 4119]ESK49068.1 hypothetical protein P255_02807 [Acinetobacter brisouii CIP 110357]
MIFPRKLITFYKKDNPSVQRCAWANYNDDGFLINITNYYGKVLKLQDGKVYIRGEIWILKGHLNKFQY